jgi:hypothetical protein
MKQYAVYTIDSYTSGADYAGADGKWITTAPSKSTRLK